MNNAPDNDRARPRWHEGTRGEYWVLAQAALFVAFAVAPRWPQSNGADEVRSMLLALRMLGGLLAAGGVVLAVAALIALRASLTPLPKPRADGVLVIGGPYRWARHPMYGGVILLTVGLSLFWLSASHGVVALILMVFFSAKAQREERWLRERYSGYAEYAAGLKKLIPGVY